MNGLKSISQLREKFVGYIYNTDETGFSMGSKAGVVVGQRDKDTHMAFHIKRAGQPNNA